MPARQNRHRRAALIGAYTRSILRYFDSASPAAVAAGADWYVRARQTAETIAAETGLQAERVVGAIAALSPRTTWSENTEGAWKMARAAAVGDSEPVVAGTTANRTKAWRILHGADPASTLGGPKVRAFHANISGDHNRVTVDVWATKACTGEPIVPRPHNYGIFERAYQLGAERVGLSPAALQAIVWVTVRGSAS